MDLQCGPRHAIEVVKQLRFDHVRGITQYALNLPAIDARDARGAIHPQIAILRTDNAGNPLEGRTGSTMDCPKPLAVKPRQAELTAPPYIVVRCEKGQDVPHFGIPPQIKQLN